MVWFALVTCAALSGASPPPAAALKALQELPFGTPCELTVTAPGTGAAYSDTNPFGFFRKRALRFFATDGQGALTAALHFPKSGRRLILRSRGRAEDLYAADALGLSEPLAKWHRQARAAVRTSADVTVAAPGPLPVRAGELEQVPAPLLAAVAAAAVKYEDKRAELFLRLGGRDVSAGVYPPPAAECRWRVFRDGDRLRVGTAFGTRFHAAWVEVEFKKCGPGAGDWEYVGLFGREFHKGE